MHRLVLLAGMACATHAASAQDVLPHCDPDVEGQWTGYWDLGPMINNQPVGQPAEWTEITHAAVLPPPNDRYILLWCERDVVCAAGVSVPYATWMFNWQNPNRPLKKVIVPQPFGTYGTTDLFCGASAFGSGGQVISFGGTDFITECGPGVEGRVGHTEVWTFDNAPVTATTPNWHPGGALGSMADRRWYPSDVELGDGDHVVLGDLECNTCTIQASYTRQRGTSTPTWAFDWETGATTSNFYNSIQGVGTTTSDEVPGTYIYLRGYPGVHLVPGNYLFTYGAGLYHEVPPQPPSLSYLGTVFLDLDHCVGDPTTQETERWIATTQSAALPQPKDYRGSTVLIVDDSQEIAGNSTSVIYAIGGDPASPNECACHDGISDQVLRMVNPSPVAVWDASVPQAKRSRKWANAVLALDGSIILFGGMTKELDASGLWTGSCAYEFRPERLKPEEVFGTPPATWTLMCQQFKRHAHHSVAGLLSNGQAFLGGGDDSPDVVPDPDPQAPPGSTIPCPVPPPTNAGIHVVELFSPPYLFQGPAPEILTVTPTSEPLQGSEIFVDADIQGPLDGQFRVALLAPGTMTHSVNFSQRYVMVRVTEQVLIASPSTWELTVRIPSAEAVPPGYYMLTVVNSEGVPSAADWIKVRAQ
jgi:hypothetical protein